MANNRLYFTESSTAKAELPDLISIQTDSYQWLFEEGLRELLDEINPVEDFTSKNYLLSFGDYALDEPKVDEATARFKNMTYKAPFRCKVTLKNLRTGQNKESEVFLGDFPVMTSRGTFIINGVERVVVTQIVRSYGVLFTASEPAPGIKKFGAKVIPTRGAWLEIETSQRDVISIKVDRKRKIPITTFLKALGGYSNTELKTMFAAVDTDKDHHYIASTAAKDTTESTDEALIDVYKRIRPGDLATADSARTFLETMFFNSKRYNLGAVGRYKMNRRLERDVPNDAQHRILLIDDVVATIREIIRLNNTPDAEADDVDHLKNRRVRAIGELVQTRLRVGFLRMERIIKDRMAMIEDAQIAPAQLVNSRPISAVLQEFFASSQLSQFMDQTNPLSELEHKRRVAATGPGGLSRERAGFEVRDVHNSHYGRICPIATPEGPNIGLVGQLASYAKVNAYGFIETPFRKVKKLRGQAKVTDEIVYLDAFDEEKYVIAPASARTDSHGYFIDKNIVVRAHEKPTVTPANKIDYVDVSPLQILSISTAMIPFVEHNDAARAQMGSNMVRQAVPLVKPAAPVVGTGIEEHAARYSSQVILAAEDGTVTKTSANLVSVKNNQGKVKEYQLDKFVRSNQGTCINQHPTVQVGDKVKKSQILAESSGMEKGEIALGQNLLVAYMSYDGYNFEDAIIISERLVHNDKLTSIHIETYSVEVRDTKLGQEVLTRDIPNVGDEALKDLDEDGIIRIGAQVQAGDILVGKISPKGETELSAEEKLLRAIFGEKAKDVMDTSLRLPHGENGTVVGVKVFARDEGDELPAGVMRSVEVIIAQLRKIQVGDKLAGRHGNKGVIAKILPVEDMPYLADGTPVDIILNPLGVVSRMNLGQILETHLGWAAAALGYKIATPVFNGISWERIQQELKKAGLPENGKVQLYDGRSGDKFAERVTVGVNYIMKLIHLVDDKIHARSTGPYSMVTQQPLGGKAQFGGQRFGEMEVWALEAYGAAHTLQETLTIKSDDIIGRAKTYEAIIKNEPLPKPSVPASFNVLVRELQGLGLSFQLITKNQIKDKPGDKPASVKTPAGKQS